MKIKELLIQGAGAPMMYYFSDYKRVMAEGEAAQKAPAIKISTNQGIKIGNLTVYKDYVIRERGATYKLRGLTVNYSRLTPYECQSHECSNTFNKK